MLQQVLYVLYCNHSHVNEITTENVAVVLVDKNNHYILKVYLQFISILQSHSMISEEQELIVLWSLDSLH